MDQDALTRNQATMDIDQYSYCPCGSGKKFKWCCQNIYTDIGRAAEQMRLGQKDTALRIMNEVAAANPTNPEAWGQLAQFYLAAEDTGKAEEALSKALELNPNYPFGLLTRANMLAQEGEANGAAILARKAAEAYHPEALDYLAQVHGLLYQIESQRHRPIAAHAALKLLIHCQPSEQEYRNALAANFGPQSPLPACARLDYAETFQPPAGAISEERRKAWNEVFAGIQSPRLQSLAATFEQITAQNPSDGPAWYNLAVAQTWLGENRKALEAIERYLPLEADEAKTTRAAALAQVLLTGTGLENDADWKEYHLDFQAREGPPLLALLQEWYNSGRLIIRPNEQENVLTALVLEKVAPAVVTSAPAAAPAEHRMAGYLLQAGPRIHLWGPDEAALDRLRAEIKTKTNNTVSEGRVVLRPANFNDVVAGALVFLETGSLPEAELRQAILDRAARYFEEEWVRRPFRYLAGKTPQEAVEFPLLRKKLLGVLQFVEDCARVGAVDGYDFNRLRARLGLGDSVAPTSSGPDVGKLNAEELGALAVEGLSDESLATAFKAARKLSASAAAVRFGTALVGRPIAAGAPDRYPYFSYLVQQSLGEGNTDAALDLVNEGQKQDCEHNEGKRRNDYELHRADVHVRRRETDQAHDVFTRLIARTPDNLKVRGKAVQGMLSLGQGGKALEFAEAGLEEARRQSDRSAEGELLELIEDAKRRK